MEDASEGRGSGLTEKRGAGGAVMCCGDEGLVNTVRRVPLFAFGCLHVAIDISLPMCRWLSGVFQLLTGPGMIMFQVRPCIIS